MKNFVAFGNNELEGRPEVKIGQRIICPHCKKKHKLEGGKDKNGEITDILLFYNCRGRTFLGAVQGRLVTGIL